MLPSDCFEILELWMARASTGQAHCELAMSQSLSNFVGFELLW
jgi:hypothetical protein